MGDRAKVDDALQTKTTIAVVFDFDDTLVPDSTVQFLESKGISREEFEEGISRRVDNEGYDPVFAYLNFILDEVRGGGRLAGIGNTDLEAFGATIRNFYPGIPDIFRELQNRAAASGFSAKIRIGKTTIEQTIVPTLEFYVVSGGLEPLVLAAMKAGGLEPFFKNRVVACRLGETDGHLSHIKRAVSFTEKTRYLYAINKGVFTDEDPYAVNVELRPEDRPVPFHNMIYVGDGFTDIPCFSLLGHSGGTPIAVVPDLKRIAKSYRRFVERRHINFFELADYTPELKNDQLGALLVALVEKLRLDMMLKIKFFAESP